MALKHEEVGGRGACSLPLRAEGAQRPRRGAPVLPADVVWHAAGARPCRLPRQPCGCSASCMHPGSWLSPPGPRESRGSCHRLLLFGVAACSLQVFSYCEERSVVSEQFHSAATMTTVVSRFAREDQHCYHPRGAPARTSTVTARDARPRGHCPRQLRTEAVCGTRDRTNALRCVMMLFISSAFVHCHTACIE